MSLQLVPPTEVPEAAATPDTLRNLNPPTGAKIRVTNLHYDLTENDLEDLFTRIGPVTALSLRYDRAGRSEGVAFVTYKRLADAQTAIREFDGANAKGQPIQLTLVASGKRNPFDYAEKPKGSSLFDRIERPRDRNVRSLSPESSSESPDSTADGKGNRRSDVSKPAPENIDRYVPGGRQRSPRRRNDGRNDGRNRGRRPGEHRDRNDSAAGAGRRAANGRPKKTQEELDQEMEDYWGAAAAADNTGDQTVSSGAPAPAPAEAPVHAHAGDDDIDMIE
ncbi:hypothetical protein AJ80_06280 [Polytolypa hystricis UAMH7299]|uniref:RRM domain-containing protein n=1 Tax=Polytolypa hystricis (strain UAMH7299) TaxID=1447883 RepID=A0A2B7XWY7_POLH7|nr:hypothetical protein AJ80_06280 [Polytolypa hystricis UAMH7299]